MAQIAAGELRYAVKDAGLELVIWSEPIPYDILDNNAAPFVYAQSGRPGEPLYGTDDDYRWWMPPELVAHGTRGEFLVVQFLDATARTPATASFTVSMGVTETYFSARAKRWAKTRRTLAVGDRVTKSTASTLNDSAGLADNTGTVAGEWSDVLRYKPNPGRNWYPDGRQRIVVEGT